MTKVEEEIIALRTRLELLEKTSEAIGDKLDKLINNINKLKWLGIGGLTGISFMLLDKFDVITLLRKVLEVII